MNYPHTRPVAVLSWATAPPHLLDSRFSTWVALFKHRPAFVYGSENIEAVHRTPFVSRCPSGRSGLTSWQWPVTSTTMSAACLTSPDAFSCSMDTEALFVWWSSAAAPLRQVLVAAVRSPFISVALLAVVLNTVVTERIRAAASHADSESL